MARILAVDDAIVMRKLVQAILEGEGHEVITLEDGLKALSFAKNETVDLVISDLYMPHMKGTSLIRQLRKLPNYENIPMLVLTTETADDMKKLARDNGADGWVQKPIVPERLVRGVTTTLSKFGLH